MWRRTPPEFGIDIEGKVVHPADDVFVAFSTHYGQAASKIESGCWSITQPYATSEIGTWESASTAKRSRLSPSFHCWTLSRRHLL